jgi:molybdate transport system regulatory protein
MATPRYTDALGHGLTDKRIDIVRGIARTGSISQAARDASVSYKAAWQAIDTLTNLAGVALVERAVGGAGGGGASLTAHGQHLLELADALEAARQAVHKRWAAGRRGDALGMESAVARMAIRTSMRNQLPVRIESLDAQGRIVRVLMQAGDSGRIAARITQESAELLGLAPGMDAMALCKATAVRVGRPDTGDVGDAAGGNLLAGVVTSVARGETGDEIALALAPGLQLVGFASARSGLRARQRVTALVDEASVVVALPG